MRKFLFVLLTSLAVVSAQAWEPTVTTSPPDEAQTQAQSLAQAPQPYGEALVTTSPVPMPAVVVELAQYSPQKTGAGQTRKAKAARVARAKSMLSRSAREQMSLANADTTTDGPAWRNASDDEEDDSGLDELDLHRSFSQPKVAKTLDQLADNDAVIDLPEHIKLRLLMARTHAVEAHILNQAGKTPDAPDETLSDTVKLRLYIARARAVQAHRDKYPS